MIYTLTNFKSCGLEKTYKNPNRSRMKTCVCVNVPVCSCLFNPTLTKCLFWFIFKRNMLTRLKNDTLSSVPHKRLNTPPTYEKNLVNESPFCLSQQGVLSWKNPLIIWEHLVSVLLAILFKQTRSKYPVDSKGLPGLSFRQNSDQGRWNSDRTRYLFD